MLALLILGMWQTYVNHFKVLIGLGPMESELSSKKNPNKIHVVCSFNPHFKNTYLLSGSISYLAFENAPWSWSYGSWI